MQNLREKLLQAGLIDKKKKKQADHQVREQRTQEKKAGRTAEQLQAERAAAREREQQEKIRRERERQLKENQERERRARRLQQEREKQAAERLRDSEQAWRKIMARSMLEANLFLPQVAGPVRFHFVARSGGIRRLEVSTRIAHDLQAGLLAICQLPYWGEEKFGLVRHDVAETLRQMDPTLVRFFLPDKEAELAPLPPVVLDPRPRSLAPPRRWHFTAAPEGGPERRE